MKQFRSLFLLLNSDLAMLQVRWLLLFASVSAHPTVWWTPPLAIIDPYAAPIPIDFYPQVRDHIWRKFWQEKEVLDDKWLNSTLNSTRYKTTPTDSLQMNHRMNAQVPQMRPRHFGQGRQTDLMDLLLYLAKLGVAHLLDGSTRHSSKNEFPQSITKTQFSSCPQF